MDGAPVDIVFLLLMPSENRSADLKILSSIARQLRSKEVQTRLRSATSVGEIHEALTKPVPD